MSEGSVESKSKVDSAGELSDVDNENCSSGGGGSSGDTKRICVDCGTLRTPLWRGGPAGPKVSLFTTSIFLDHDHCPNLSVLS